MHDDEGSRWKFRHVDRVCARWRKRFTEGIKKFFPGLRPLYFTHDGDRCDDCHLPVRAGPILHDGLWATIAEPHAFLCLDCTEKRLGRPLTDRTITLDLYAEAMADYHPAAKRRSERRALLKGMATPAEVASGRDRNGLPYPIAPYPPSGPNSKFPELPNSAVIWHTPPVRNGPEGLMTDEESKQRIRQWQNRLHEAFDYNGVLGGQFLSETMQLEEIVGQLFVQKYHGHRLLTDAFLDFFAETLQTQLAFHAHHGWPSSEPNYALTFLMYLTTFRTVRATEVLSVHGYPLQGYALQRSIKDQIFILWAIANNMMGFNETFGWQEGLTFDGTGKMAANRTKAERKIRSVVIGKELGLSQETQTELLDWEQMFNLETHRGLFTLVDTFKDAVKGKLVVVGPRPDERNEAMFFNRSNELNWMILRLSCRPNCARRAGPRAILSVWRARRRFEAISFPPSPAVLPIGHAAPLEVIGVRPLGHAELHKEGADRVSADQQIAGETLVPLFVLVGVHRESSVAVRDNGSTARSICLKHICASAYSKRSRGQMPQASN